MRKTAIAAEGDEVIATFGLVALQVAGHEGIVTPGTLYPTHPQRTRMNGAPAFWRVAFTKFPILGMAASFRHQFTY